MPRREDHEVRKGHVVHWEKKDKKKEKKKRKNQHSQILGSAHTVYLCVLYGSKNKQRLFPYTALIDWVL